MHFYLLHRKGNLFELSCLAKFPLTAYTSTVASMWFFSQSESR
jgi:hypothetical protein